MVIFVEYYKVYQNKGQEYPVYKFFDTVQLKRVLKENRTFFLLKYRYPNLIHF